MSPKDEQTPSKGQIILPGLPGSDETAPHRQSAGGASEPSFPTTSRSGAHLPQIDAHDKDTPQLRESMFSFLTGRDGHGATTGGGVASKLMAAFGPSKRDSSRPDTAAAAKGLGVSQRQVQRWLKGENAPRADRVKSLDKRARQAMTTKTGRARSLKSAMASGHASMPPSKNSLTIAGYQGISSDKTAGYRMRECSVQMTAADLKDLQDTWVAHGDKGAAAWMTSHMDTHYASGWHIREIEDLSWGNSSNY